jgi:signal recognition particle subunit SEC65
MATKITKTTKMATKTKSAKATPTAAKTKVKAKPAPVVKVRHVQVKPVSLKGKRSPRAGRVVPQYAYMKAPGLEHVYEVGDTVEVFCDHEKNSDRVRGWVKGIVVQVDNKMVAVQFRSNVFLTDGWMVPDRILWYPLTSDQIRAMLAGRKYAKNEIPEF